MILPLEFCAEYDAAANYLAERGLSGDIGDPLPANMSATGALKYIQADPEAFQERVRQSAYALAMSRVNEEAAFYCPRGYGECEDARACIYPGRCGRSERAEQTAHESEYAWRMGL